MKRAVLAVALVGALSQSSGLLAADASRVSVAPKGHYAKLDALPDWGGAWFLNGEGGPGAIRQPPPKLKGPYLAAFEKWRQDVKAKEGNVAVTQSNCMPPGMPVVMSVGQYPVEFLFSPGRVTMHFEAWMQWRNIYTDGRKHPEDLEQSFQGDSVGHWEGDTLVVETVGVNENLGLSLATRGPVPAHSAKLRILERIHLNPKDANTLVVDMTLDDPEALAEPYKQTLTFRRDRDQELLEFVCAENDRNPVDAHGNTTFTHE
jgi:hypothetical protein